jgi:hypothetical protein
MTAKPGWKPRSLELTFRRERTNASQEPKIVKVDELASAAAETG